MVDVQSMTFRRPALVHLTAFAICCCFCCNWLRLPSTSFTSPSLTRRQIFAASISHTPVLLVAAPESGALEQRPSAAQCIRDMAAKNAQRDPEAAPSFLRLAFHDAATKRSDSQGPNGSIRFELMRNENIGPSLRRALQFIEEIVDKCQVSWADAVAVSGAAVVEALGGPKIQVATGRKDATAEDAENRLPDGSLTSGAIRDYFRQLGFSDEELVALLGAHTIGRWTSLLGVQPACMAEEGLKFWICTREQGKRLPFTSRPTLFNNDYFKEVLEFERRQNMPRPKKRYKDRPENGLPPLYLLPSDIGLLYDSGLHKQVEKFAMDEAAFFAAFSKAYLKLVS